jgi:hypothetical protein
MQKALERMMEAITTYGSVALLYHLPDNAPNSLPPNHSTNQQSITQPTNSPSLPPPTIVFIINPPTATSYRLFDTSLRMMNDSHMLQISERLGEILEPFVLFTRTLKNSIVSVVCVPRTTQQLKEMDDEQAAAELSTAAELAVAIVATNGAVAFGGGAKDKLDDMKSMELPLLDRLSDENAECDEWKKMLEADHCITEFFSNMNVVGWNFFRKTQRE